MWIVHFISPCLLLNFKRIAMTSSFEKIVLAVAFSPTASAMVHIGSQLSRYFNAQLVIAHVGTRGAEQEQKMSTLLKEAGIEKETIKIIWATGDPTKGILKICLDEKADLLVAGALKSENLVQYYIGTIARKIMREAKCSVLMIQNPSSNSIAFKNVVVNAEDGSLLSETLSLACLIGNKSQSNWVHVVRELKLYGLTMVANEDCSEEEYDEVRHKLVKDEIEKVEAVLHHIAGDKPKLNIKIISGKSGFELSKFAERKQADLLIINAPQHKSSFFSRVFPNDLEYIFADLPCNLLVVHPKKKEVTHG